MVTKHLENLISGDSEFARSLSEQIQGLEIKSLRKIKNKTAIETICNEVIRAVDDLLLVHIDENELRNRKIKKQKYSPIVHTDDDRWSQSAIIRSDWNSERWLENPHGWVYYDSNSSILGVIYETGERNSGTYSSFLKKEVADNPIGAILLLKEMKDRLNKITHKK